MLSLLMSRVMCKQTICFKLILIGNLDNNNNINKYIIIIIIKTCLAYGICLTELLMKHVLFFIESI